LEFQLGVKKGKNMEKRFFKYDDNNVFLFLVSIVTIALLVMTIILYEYLFMFVLCIVLSVVGFTGILFIRNIGIHLYYNKNKIIIIDSLLIRSISISDVQYISLLEDKKSRKKSFHLFSPDSLYRAYWTESSKYVYREGKTYRIIFHLKDKSIIVSYYGWLFKAKSKKRVILQEKKIKNIIQEFMQYKKTH
jgi:hypothetical protein